MHWMIVSATAAFASSEDQLARAVADVRKRDLENMEFVALAYYRLGLELELRPLQ